jgi:hypothetical protein
MSVFMRVRASPSVKLAGVMAAEFGNYEDGARIRPGAGMLAAVSGEMDERTARGALRQLRDWGLLWQYVEGSRYGRRRVANEYRLTLPDDLLDRVPMLTPDFEAPVIGADHRVSDPLMNGHGPEQRVSGPVNSPICPFDHRTSDPVHVDNSPDHRVSDPLIAAGAERTPGLSAGTPGLRYTNTGSHTRPPIHDLSMTYPPSKLEVLTSAAVESSAAGGEVRSRIDVAAPPDDPEAHRQRQVDRLAAWAAGQSQSAGNDTAGPA